MSETNDNIESKEKGFLMGHVFFRYQKDDTQTRGFLQKSIVLLTRLPFVYLFYDVIYHLGSLYFDQYPFDNSSATKTAQRLFAQAFAEINEWPLPQVDTHFSLMLLGKQFEFRTPVFAPYGAARRIVRAPDAYAQGTSQSAPQSASSSRTYSPISPVALDDSLPYPSISSFPSLAPPGTSPSRSVIKGGHVSASSQKIKARLFGKKHLFYDSCVNAYRIFYNPIHLDNLIRYWELLLTGEPLLVYSPSPDQCSNAVLALVSLLAPIQCSADYRPFFTVHNTEFKHFSAMGETQGFSPVVLGVTNPFFVKSFEKWPHIICVGEKEFDDVSSTSSTGSSNGIGSTNLNIKTSAQELVGGLLQKVGGYLGIAALNTADYRSSLMWEWKEMFWTEKTAKDFVVKNEKQALRKRLLLPSGSGASSTPSSTSTPAPGDAPSNLPLDAVEYLSIETVNNETLRRLFEDLTEQFLYPLHRCFDTLLCSMKSFILRSTHGYIFKPEKFYSYVEKNGYVSSIFQGTRYDVLALYQKFIFSGNFQSFLYNRLAEAYRNEVLHSDFSSFMLSVKAKSEVSFIDLFLRLRDDLEQEMEGVKGPGARDKAIETRLYSFLVQITEYINDENMRRSLR